MLLATNPDPEYDAIARAGCTEKQLALLEAIPARLPDLSFDDLLIEGLRIRRSYDDVAQVIRAQVEEGKDAVPSVMQRAMVVEYILRRTCLIFVDEVRRRRTGVAPRAVRPEGAPIFATVSNDATGDS